MSERIRHLVLFGFTDDVSREVIVAAARRFAQLRTLVPGIETFEWGENVSPEGLANGHTHAFVLTFLSLEARDAYLIHPDHVEFTKWVKPLLARATVVDFVNDGKHAS
jgi:hypothetical protein